MVNDSTIQTPVPTLVLGPQVKHPKSTSLTCQDSTTCYIAKLTLQNPDGKQIDLHAFDKILSAIADVPLNNLLPKHLMHGTE